MEKVTFDLTPSWSALVNPMLDIIKQGTNTKSPFKTDLQFVRQQFEEMAGAADKWNAHVKESKKEVVCPKCGSHEIRGIDNESLYAPSVEDVAKGVSSIDREMYVICKCDDCGNQFSKEFKLI